MASPSSSALFTASFIVFIFFQLSLIFQASSARGISMDPTEGFMELPFNASFYEIQHPYNVQEDRRYSFVNGVHKLWVFRNDKPHFRGSHTKPRTEIGIEGYSYSSGVWQFEGYGYVPQGTNGVCIMQVFGATEDATTLMLHVYNGALHYYEDALVAPNIVNRWFRLNVIHDVSANNLKVFIDGQLKLSVKGRGRTTHFFKCGVYTQLHASNRMESQWRNVRILKKGTN